MPLAGWIGCPQPPEFARIQKQAAGTQNTTCREADTQQDTAKKKEYSPASGLAGGNGSVDELGVLGELGGSKAGESQQVPLFAGRPRLGWLGGKRT
jgi:hypothetical protein